MLLEQLHKASFKGVSFLVDTMSTTGGRKTATHDYINQSVRYVEDLGRLPKTLTITGFITEPNYIVKRDALVLALEIPGLGPLIHPTLGGFNVVAKPYTLTESMDSVNIATFELTFEEARLPIYPIDSGNSISKLIDEIDNVFNGVQDYIGDTFSLIYDNFANLTDISFKINSIISDYESAVKDSGSGYDSTVNDLASTLDSLSENLIQQVYDPDQLGETISTIGEQTTNLSPDPKNNFGLNQGLFYFGNDDVTFEANTAILRERELNRHVMNNSINAISLSNAYLNSVQIDFETLDDIKLIQDALEDQFNYLSSLADLPDDVMYSVKNIRLYAMDYFEKEKLVVYKISEIDTERTTMRELTYRYYGDLEQYEELVTLNNILNPSFVEGEVEILTL